MTDRLTNSTWWILVVVAGCSTASTPGNIDLERWRNAEREPGQWLALGRTYKGDRFSPLTRVTADNAAGLGLMGNLRRDNFHGDREAESLRGARRLSRTRDQPLARHRNAI